MPRHDLFHDNVRNALIKEGWTITHDPLTIPFGGDNVYIDLGAEQPLGAERNGQKIAVEIKSFRNPSAISDLQSALGQYRLYRFALLRYEAERLCVLAIPSVAYENLFQYTDLRDLMEAEQVNLMVFHPEREEVTLWIPILT